MSNKIVLVLVSVLGLTFLTSCEEDADNKLAKAQSCFDKVPDSAPNSAAEACEAILGNITTAESYVLRCAIKFFVGGVKTSAIIGALEAMENAAENDKAGILIGALSHTGGSAVANSTTTKNTCEKSGVSSLIYFANLSYVGSLMIDAEPGNSTDPNDFVDNCVDNPSDCDDVAIGSAVVALHDVYCIGDAAENPPCTEISTAIASGGGDPAAIAVALYAALQ